MCAGIAQRWWLRPVECLRVARGRFPLERLVLPSWTKHQNVRPDPAPRATMLGPQSSIRASVWFVRTIASRSRLRVGEFAPLAPVEPILDLLRRANNAFHTPPRQIGGN